MENCSEFNCRSKATQVIQLNTGRKLYCDHHFRHKMQILKPQRSSLFISQNIASLREIVHATNLRIILESAHTLKAIQLKTQADLQILSKFLKSSIAHLSSLNPVSTAIVQDFQKILDGEPHFFTHFQELGKKIKELETNMKTQNEPVKGWRQPVKPQEINQPRLEKKIIIPRLEKKYEETKADSVTLPVKIAPTKKTYDDYAETVTMPIRSSQIDKTGGNFEKYSVTLPAKPSIDQNTYYIETKIGLQTIPGNVVEQIIEARQRNLFSVEIFNNGKKTNYIDLVNWKSYKIFNNGERDSFYYQIHPPRT